MAASARATGMKFRNEIVIDAEPESVWDLFIDPGRLRGWQPTLTDVKPKSGMAAEPGAKTELLYDENGRRFVVTETVLETRRPDFLARECESPWSKAVVVHRFEPVDPGRTRCIVYSRHSFKGVGRFTALFQHGRIERRNDDWLQRFKLLVESVAAGTGA